MKRLCVLLPAYNEGKNIGPVVQKILRVSIPDLAIIPVVVNDGSKDDTVRAAEEAGAKVISHVTNLGVGAGFKTGLLYAREQEFDYLLHMDSDGQVNPEEIPKLVEPVMRGECDLALGSRFYGKSPEKLSKWKAGLLQLLTKTLGLLTGSNLSDISCGFRCMNQKVMNALHPHFNYDYIQESLIQALAVRARTKDIAVNILYDAEGGGMSKRPIRYISRFLTIMTVALVNFYLVRLRSLISPSLSK
jgi:glycosyltransferase involved in cell wall biosynthesis